MWELEFSRKRKKSGTIRVSYRTKKVEYKGVPAEARLWSADMMVNTRVPPGDQSPVQPGVGHHHEERGPECYLQPDLGTVSSAPWAAPGLQTLHEETIRGRPQK